KVRLRGAKTIGDERRGDDPRRTSQAPASPTANRSVDVPPQRVVESAHASRPGRYTQRPGPPGGPPGDGGRPGRGGRARRCGVAGQGGFAHAALAQQALELVAAERPGPA